jgi:hypothetical protein
MGERVCRLPLLLASPAQSFSGPSTPGLVTFYCLRFETSPSRRARSPYLYPPGTGWPSYTPRHWASFPSPPTTLRGVFDPVSTRVLNSPLKVKVTLRLTVSEWVSQYWCRAQSGAYHQIDIHYCLTVSVLFLWDALSDERVSLWSESLSAAVSHLS